jgi:calcineurin-like phosphoesterase family protein
VRASRAGRARFAAVLAGMAAAITCGGGATPTPVPSPLPIPSPDPPRLATLAAAGDIVCAPGSRDPCRDVETLAVVESLNPDLVLPLGDNQYESGTASEYSVVYNLSWGRLRSRSRPVPGNHEYQGQEGNARGYYDYFNGVGAYTGIAGDRDKGYYSFDFADWHFIALNSNCNYLRGGCGAGGFQEKWLREDLQRNQRPCTLAYSHHPRFSSGTNGSSRELQPLWQALYEGGADVYLAGHDHHYERFAPQRADGMSDPDRGLREFVVGTGGRSITPFRTILPNSEVQDTTSFGVLVLRLGPTGYGWRFMATTGMPLADSGTATCH